MSKKHAAALAVAATVAAVDPNEVIKGLFLEFRSEGRHIIGTLETGEEVKITEMVNGGEGLPSEEIASQLADKLNLDEAMAHLMGVAIEFKFDKDGVSTRKVSQAAAEAN